jgi:hypothetical protein
MIRMNHLYPTQQNIIFANLFNKIILLGHASHVTLLLYLFPLVIRLDKVGTNTTGPTPT